MIAIALKGAVATRKRHINRGSTQQMGHEIAASLLACLAILSAAQGARHLVRAYHTTDAWAWSGRAGVAVVYVSIAAVFAMLVANDLIATAAASH